MKFRTELIIPRAEKPLDPHKPVTLIGSCFAENIGRKMQESMWNVYVNPCGIHYNPYTIGEIVMSCLLPEEMMVEMMRRSITQRDGVYVSWYFDSSVSGTTSEECVQAGVRALKNLAKALMESQACVITWGTANVYRLKSLGYKIVTNCHKHPSAEFQRSRLSVSDIVKWNEIIANSLDNRLWHLRTILTVSPVRYIADGFVDNSRSKANLLLAAETVDRMFEQIEYFPAYEIVNDDLRDYRYYADDLVHPSEAAIEYVWQKFVDCYIDEEGKRYLKDGHDLYARMHHRPIFPDSEADRKFKARTEELLRLRNKNEK